MAGTCEPPSECLDGGPLARAPREDAHGVRPRKRRQPGEHAVVVTAAQLATVDEVRRPRAVGVRDRETARVPPTVEPAHDHDRARVPAAHLSEHRQQPAPPDTPREPRQECPRRIAGLGVVRRPEEIEDHGRLARVPSSEQAPEVERCVVGKRWIELVAPGGADVRRQHGRQEGELHDRVQAGLRGGRHTRVERLEVVGARRVATAFEREVLRDRNRDRGRAPLLEQLEVVIVQRRGVRLTRRLGALEPPRGRSTEDYRLVELVHEQRTACAEPRERAGEDPVRQPLAGDDALAPLGGSLVPLLRGECAATPGHARLARPRLRLALEGRLPRDRTKLLLLGGFPRRDVGVVAPAGNCARLRV